MSFLFSAVPKISSASRFLAGSASAIISVAPALHLGLPLALALTGESGALLEAEA